MRFNIILIAFLFLSNVSFGQIFNDCESIELSDLINQGDFNVSSIDESDNIRNGPDYSGATIYYPNNANSLLSSIILVPGYTNTESTIQNWGPFLASHGIVTMTIGTNSLLDSPIERKDALLDAIITLKSEYYRIESPLFNSLDTNNFAVGGFSMGGGGAQLAAITNPTIKAVIALYPFLETDEENLNNNSPLLIISGQLDIIAPPSLHANIHYNITPNSTPKQLYEIQFANHDFISGPNGGSGEVGAKVLAWLQSFLLENHCYCSSLLENPTTASDFIHNIICEDLFIQGCTDPIACNFNELANVDNGNCEFPNGCGDPLYLEYDDNVICSNPLDCITLIITGCTDPSACNFNELANIDDNSCCYEKSPVTISVTECDSYMWDESNLGNNETFFISGSYTNNSINECGCNYTSILDLWLNYSDSIFISDTSNQTYNWNGQIINSSGSYTDFFTNIFGCDSIVTLNLIINNSSLITNHKQKTKQIYKVTDIIGQDTPLKKNTPLLYLYDDGTVEKKIILEY